MKKVVGQVQREQIKNRAWIELDLEHLAHNVGELRRVMPDGCNLMAVLKANAYGHGAKIIAEALNQLGVTAFATATIDEAIQLRQWSTQGEILVLGYTHPQRAGELARYQISQTLIDYDYAVLLERQGYEINTHIKIDTGMHRLGFEHQETEHIANMFQSKFLKVCGMFTQLCVSDSLLAEDIAFTRLQIKRFYQLLSRLSQKGLRPANIHLQSSYGLLNYPELKCDSVRIGLALYGVSSKINEQTKLQLDLRPVLSLKSRIIFIRTIKCGDTIGYGRTFTSSRDSTIAVLPIGYADGIPRNLSAGNSYVLVHGEPAPMIGPVYMDQLTIDITGIPDVKTGDIVTLIGTDGMNELPAAVVASKAGKISGELLSQFHIRPDFMG